MSRVKSPAPLPKIIAKAQKLFNEYIRLRDADKGCITCNGSIEHACHFYSAGQHTALRFNEDNVHGGCLKCNYFLHGNLNIYRMNIIKRIGQTNLDLLDSVGTRHKTKTWSRTELEQIIEIYKEKIKCLKNQ